MELVQLLISLLSQQGVTGVIVVCFISLVFWVVKKFDKMQEKQYSIIESLSSELPQIRSSLEEIKRAIERKE